jgi:GNAT superfamily N-acetyltransferase
MADIFADTTPQYFKGEGSNGVTRYTGDEDTDKYLNSLPPEKRADALKRLTAPLTGEELAEKAKDPNFTMDRSQYGRFIEWKKTEDKGILDDIGMLAEGGMHIFEQIYKTASSVKDHPLESMAKLGPSGIEAFYQGTRNMYGMLAQSQDPTSKFFRFKAAIMGEDSDQGYNQYLEAREFNRDSIQYAEGKKTMLINKDYIDHEMTQAMSYIADPSLLIPFAKIGGIGLRAVGMGEKAAVVAARAGHIKNMILGGTLKYMVGKPIEFIGGATRGVIDYGITTGALATEAVTGMSAREIATTVRMGSLGTTAASLAGHSAPIISDVSKAYVAGGAAQGLGQALGAIGNQMQRGPRGFISYAKAALEADKAILSPHAQNLLKIINAADPLLSLTADVAKGSSHGLLIGGGLGYGNAGYEGMWQGAGAGIALGGVGGLAGSMLARASGGKTIERADITAKYAIEGAKQVGKIHQAQSWEFLRKVGELTGTKPMMDGIVAALDSLAPDARYVFRDDTGHNKFLDTNGFDRKTGQHKTNPNAPRQLSTFEHINMDGVVMESGPNGEVTMHINTTKLMKGAKGGFRPKTVPHEMLHLILRKSVLTPQFLENLKHDVLGVRDSAGKLLEGGSVDPKEIQTFFREYVKRTYNKVDKSIDPTGHANEAKRLTDIVDRAISEYEKTGSITLTEKTIGSRPLLEHLMEEFGAYYFQELVGAKSPDWLYFAGKYEGMRGVLDRTVNRFTDHWEKKRSSLDPLFSFSENKSIAEGFRDKSGKRVRVGSIDYMISDFLKMVQNQNRTGRVDLSLMSDKARGELILRKGLDDLGRARGARDPRKNRNLSNDLQLGKAIHAELLAINPARQTDGAGNLVGHLTDTDIAGLVRAGHISSAMGQKIKTLQALANNPDKVVFEAGYWGESHTTETGPNAQRVFGDEVPYTQRQGILLGVDVKINKNGKVSMVARTLDLRVNRERADNMWANPSVRDLWNGDRNLFAADYIKYLLNMGKDTAGGKIESSKLLDNGDGKGGQRRDVMHQVAGVPLGSGDAYVNHPIGEIHHDALNAYTMLSIGRMQDVRLTGESITGFDPAQAIPDIGRNFSPSDMNYRETPNGKQWEHKSGYKFHQVAGGKTIAYDRRGETIGSYDTPEQAMLAGRQKLQAQQKALHQVAQDVKAAHDRGAHFSPREDWAKERATEEYHGTGFGARLREDYLAMLKELKDEHDAKIGNPQVDRRLINGIKNKIAMIPKIIEAIDSKQNLFSEDVRTLIQHTGIPVPANPDASINISAGDAWLYTLGSGMEKHYKSWDKMYPMTFRSALNERIQQILKSKPNITAQQLRKQLLQYGSRTGERLWAEAEAIGFIDWIESKIEPTYKLTRKYDDNGVLLPRGEEHNPVLKKKGERDSTPLDPKEITDFIKNNGLSINIDTGSKSINVSNTENYTFGGTKAGYNETPIRIVESKYHHGVTGHYGGDTIVHTRKTIRFDSEGNKYIYIEEVQSNNAEGKPMKGALSENLVRDTQGNIQRLKGILSVVNEAQKEFPLLREREQTIKQLETYHHTNVAYALASKKVEPSSVPYRAPTVSEWKAGDASIRKVAKEVEQFIAKNPQAALAHLITQSTGYDSGYVPDDFVVFQTRRSATHTKDVYGNPVPDLNITFGELKQIIKEHPDIFSRLADEIATKKMSTDSGVEALASIKRTNGSEIVINVGGKTIDFDQAFYVRGMNTGGKPHLNQAFLAMFQEVASQAKEPLLDTYSRRSWGRAGRKGLTASYTEHIAHMGNNSSLVFKPNDWNFYDAVLRHFTESDKKSELNEIYEQNSRYKQKLGDHLWDNVFTPEDKALYNNQRAMFHENDTRIYALEDVDAYRAELADYETILQRHQLASKGKPQPLQELYDRARISLLELAAYSIREGVDNLVLTHPDDAPTVSMMKYDARTGFYGKALPQVWGGIIAKYGMEVKSYNSTERFLKGVDVAGIPEIKQGFKTLSDASSETFAKCKTLLDMYETGVAAKITNENVTFITQTTSRPIHEVTTPRQGQPDFEGQVKQTVNSLSKRVKDGEIPAEFLDAYVNAIEAKRAESKAFEEMVQRVQNEQSKAGSNKLMSRDEIITAMALSRGKHIVMSDKFKADVMSGKLMTTFSVADGGMEKSTGGRTYDFASDMFRKSFIGRYYNENKDTLPKGMTIEYGQIHHNIGDPQFGFTLAIQQGNTASGKPKQIAYINASVEGDKAYVSSTGVAESMRGNKLNNVLMSELAERVRSMGVKYLDGVIIDPAQRPYHARMRTIGNADTIAGAYYDTTRSTLDPDAYYSPSDYDGSDSYYKPKKNKFNSKDEQGFLIRKAFIRDDNLDAGIEYNPESVDWHDIGHYPQGHATKAENQAELKNSGLWYWKNNEGVRKINPAVEMDRPDFTHDEWFGKKFKYDDDRPDIFGRYEKPEYDKKGNLVKRGRISLRSGYKDPIMDMGEAKFYKETIASSLGFPEDHFDAYLFGANKQVKNSVGLSGDDRLPIQFSVNDSDKGGRTYDTKSLKWKKGFIGRYASENPDMTKEVKLSFETEKASPSNRPTLGGRIQGKVTHNHYLQITEAGKEVGHITWKTVKMKDGRLVFNDPSVRVEPEYQGKKFQHLLYSEAAERARAMGASDFFQRIENDLGLPLKSQVKTFGETYSKLLDQYTGQYMPPTMENFNRLKFPETEIHMTESDGTVNIEKHKGHELWVYAWSKVKSDAWYALNERDALVLRKSEDMPWFKKALAEAGGFVRYATAEDLNEIRGLHAVSHGPDTLSGTDINTVGGERVLEGAGGLPYPMLQAYMGSPAAWASQGTGFVDIVNSAVQANKDAGKGNTAIMPLVFTTYEKARASVQGSEAYYRMFEIFRRGKIVSDRDLRLAMLEAVEKVDRKKKTVKDDKGKAIIDETTGEPQKEVVIENRQTDALRKIVSDNKMNWDEMLASVMLTLDDGQVQNFGTRAPMADDFMGAVWDRVMKGLSEKKKQEVMRFFPEWDVSQTKNEFTLANFKMTMGKTISDSLTRGLKSGDVYAVFKFTDFVEAMKSGHRTYDTGIVQKNGQKPELLLLKKPINVMDLHEIAISEESGSRPISSIPEDTRTNVLGMNNIPYGRTITKGVGQVDFRDMMANMSVAENFKEKTTPTGKVLQAVNGYIIMLQGDKFKVYNQQKVQVGIYASEQEAKKRAMRDTRR